MDRGKNKKRNATLEELRNAHDHVQPRLPMAQLVRQAAEPGLWFRCPPHPARAASRRARALVSPVPLGARSPSPGGELCLCEGGESRPPPETRDFTYIGQVMSSVHEPPSHSRSRGVEFAMACTLNRIRDEGFEFS